VGRLASRRRAQIQDPFAGPGTEREGGRAGGGLLQVEKPEPVLDGLPDGEGLERDPQEGGKPGERLEPEAVRLEPPPELVGGDTPGVDAQRGRFGAVGARRGLAERRIDW
jgi:hypothetical protein